MVVAALVLFIAGAAVSRPRWIEPWVLVRAALISLAGQMVVMLMGNFPLQGYCNLLTIVVPIALISWTHLRIRIGVALYLFGVSFYAFVATLPRGLPYRSQFGILATIVQVASATAPALLGLAVAHLITRRRVMKRGNEECRFTRL